MKNQQISTLKNINFCAKIVSKNCHFCIYVFAFVDVFEIRWRQYLTCNEIFEESKPKII